MTPDELKALGEKLDALIRPYIGLTRTDAPDGSDVVELRLNAYLHPDALRTAAAQAGTGQNHPAPKDGDAMTDTLSAPDRLRSPLRQRNFGLVWASSFVSDAGDWLLMIALPLFAFAVTGSALGASTVFLAELLPTLVLGSFLGVLVDRWDHRRTMIVVNLLQGLFLLPLLFASAEHIWIVYVVAAVEACLAALFNPARQALVPRLVPPEQLGTGNALMAVSENLARLIGSPLGGLAFATVGLPGVVVVDAATYVVSALLVALSRPLPSGDEHADGPLPRIHFLRQWVDGLTTIRRTRPLGTIAVITFLGQFAQGIFLVLFIVYVVQQLGAGDTAVGVLRGVQAIGGVAGGLLVGVLIRRLSPRTLVGWGYVLFGADLDADLEPVPGHHGAVGVRGAVHRGGNPRRRDIGGHDHHRAEGDATGCPGPGHREHGDARRSIPGPRPAGGRAARRARRCGGHPERPGDRVHRLWAHRTGFPRPRRRGRAPSSAKLALIAGEIRCRARMVAVCGDSTEDMRTTT